MPRFTVYVEARDGKGGGYTLSDRELNATRPDIAVANVLKSLGVTHTKYYGDKAAPVRLKVGERITIQVQRIG